MLLIKVEGQEDWKIEQETKDQKTKLSKPNHKKNEQMAAPIFGMQTKSEHKIWNVLKFKIPNGFQKVDFDLICLVFQLYFFFCCQYSACVSHNW